MKVTGTLGNFDPAEVEKFFQIFGDLGPRPRLMQWECRRMNPDGTETPWELMRAPQSFSIKVKDPDGTVYHVRTTLVTAENDDEH